MRLLLRVSLQSPWRLLSELKSGDVEDEVDESYELEESPPSPSALLESPASLEFLETAAAC